MSVAVAVYVTVAPDALVAKTVMSAGTVTSGALFRTETVNVPPVV
jgi:hypothetical protein